MAKINKRSLTFFVDGDEFTADVSNLRFNAAQTDSDFVSFAAAAEGGGIDYTLQGTAAQDAATGSFWDIFWSHAGEELDYIVKPYGNAVASSGQPHYTGTLVVPAFDGDFLGGDADASATAVQTYDFSAGLLAKPAKVVA